MALNWNEIKDLAVRFSKEWEGTTSEDAEAKSFLDAFFIYNYSQYLVSFVSGSKVINQVCQKQI